MSQEIERGRAVALIELKTIAIDHKPIYRIKITHALACGDILEWDRAEKFVRYIDNVKNTNNHD